MANPILAHARRYAPDLRLAHPHRYFLKTRPGAESRLYLDAAYVPATVQMQLGLLELGRGHVADAYRLMLEGLREDARLRPHTLELGELALQHHDPRSARFFFALIVAVDSSSVVAHVGLGTSLILTGEHDAGVVEWRRAFAIDPNFPGLREQLAHVESGR